MNSENPTSTFYSEVQRVRQIWIWLFVISIAGLSWYFFIEQVLMGVPLGNRPAPNAVMVIFWLIFGIGFPLFFSTAKLITEVRNDGVCIRFLPFHWTSRKIAFREIERYFKTTYNPILEYGGWGIRKGHRGTAYTMSGNQGIQLELFDTRRILIGTRQPEELFHAIQIHKDNH